MFVVCSIKQETPRDAVMPSGSPSILWLSIELLIRSAAIKPPRASIPGKIIKNSSPPYLDGMSTLLAVFMMTLAIAEIALSPVECP